ncbi:MAG: arsenite methyltransferase [Bacteroidetes bacterium]|nr:arsenite methyltransferase [Bacteroidota bacterium]
MSTDTVKRAVIDNYSKLARSTNGKLLSRLFGCCNPGDTTARIGKEIGYSQEAIESVPEGSNLGVGCGNPSAMAAIQLGQTVVDLGSGAGFDAFIVSPIVGDEGHVIGVDLSDDMLALANKNARKGNFRNVEFVKGDIEALPLEDDLADHIISNCVINLSLNKADVFKEAYRTLKPGGKLSVSDIVLEKELPDFIKNSLAGHVACVSGAEKIETYLKYVSDAGFKDIVITKKSRFPLELMLTDPQLINIARDMNFDLNSEEAKDIAGRITSISLTAKK